MMFQTLSEHYDHLDELLARQPKEVFISTFGLYAGITHEGIDYASRFHSPTRHFLDNLKQCPSVKIMVGVPEYISCSKDNRCKNCEHKYLHYMVRLLNHVETYPEFKWRMKLQFHIKCFLFFYDGQVAGVAGGRNLTDSGYEDVTFPIDAKLCKDFLKSSMAGWKAAMVANESAVETILKSQRIKADIVDGEVQIL